MTIKQSSGLDGVVVGDTHMSRVDGRLGRLTILGWPVEELARACSVEEALALALRPPSRERERPPEPADLGPTRLLAFEALPPLPEGPAMAALQAAVAWTRPSNPEEAVAVLAVATAAWVRRQRGLAPTRPDPSLTHAEDLQRCLAPPGAFDAAPLDGGPSKAKRQTEPLPNAAAAEALQRYLVAVLDHGFNASTFAARVAASTGAGVAASVLAGLAALEGPLHGGAPGPVLDMLDAIGAGEPEPWIETELDAGRRIMGFGHRVYRVRDPRAAVLEEALGQLGGSPRLRLARKVEAAATVALARRHPDRALPANVEFFTALLLERLGVPREAFTAVFACGRVIGWLGHAREQRSGRLLRPRGRYVGPEPTDEVRGDSGCGRVGVS